MYVCMYVYIHTYIRFYTYVHTYAYTHTHIHAYINTHTLTHNLCYCAFNMLLSFAANEKKISPKCTS